jgi:hypothetical protein
MIEHGAVTGSALKRKRDEDEPHDGLENTPAATVLLALPMLVGYPPDHPMHIPGLRASLKALRSCTGLGDQTGSSGERETTRKRARNDDGRGVVAGEALTPELEVRAWMALAEVGMMAVKTRCSRWGEHDEAAWQWTVGVEQDVSISGGGGLAANSFSPQDRHCVA